ncbi:MAG: hypothetical protein KAV00_01805 [Phycisphaerae bacterium]|nr:hypothetical protein [Phycisphaerae bacterium]
MQPRAAIRKKTPGFEAVFAISGLLCRASVSRAETAESEDKRREILPFVLSLITHYFHLRKSISPTPPEG